MNPSTLHDLYLVIYRKYILGGGAHCQRCGILWRKWPNSIVFSLKSFKESCQAELGKLSFAKDTEQSRSIHGNITGKRVSDIWNRLARLHLPSRTVELWWLFLDACEEFSKAVKAVTQLRYCSWTFWPDGIIFEKWFGLVLASDST